MLLAFDNTDGPDGGCTTHATFRVLLALPELALLGMPRLVRLNPNVPWKTRGNAAVVLPLGKPEGPQVRVGEFRGREVLAFPDGTAAPATADVVERVWTALKEISQPTALPGVAAFDEAPPAGAYWAAVRTFVPPAEAAAAVAELGAPHRAAADQRGLVGCLAAAAWPGPPSSFELIAYREPRAWGTPRAVEPSGLLGLDATGATFHTMDPTTGRLACVPKTADPVLCGLRGRDSETLLAAAVPALARAAQEPIDGWLLWATNQASGDHVTPVADLAEAPAIATVAVAAKVTAIPRSEQGGHVVVQLKDRAGVAFQAVAFEPTHGLRDVVRALREGDGITVVGALRDGSIRLEKLKVEALAPQTLRLNPLCPRCNRPMRSKGISTGFRCPDCHTKLPASAAGSAAQPRNVPLGWHEAPVMARRHLHRPLAFD